MTAAEPRVRLEVLGALRAEVDGGPAELGGPRRRAVLARLAVAPGQVVSSDRLIEDLWPGEPPPRALAALQVHVSHLRRALEPARPPRAPATVLVSAAPGYALRLPREAVDAHRFAAGVEAAAAVGAADAEPLLRAALAQWSGPAFAEFADEPWAAPAAAALDELRLVASERLAQARLALGLPAVPDLERLVHDHPLREGAVRLLALALYRTGRQGDALATLAAVRKRLADELGVDPGPELTALESAILRHTDQVVVPEPVRVGPAPPAPRPVRSAPELVGREVELARLAAAAERATRSGLQLVLVSGDAGGGKTALVEAARARLATAGWATATGRCPEVDGAPPGWAWGELLDDLPAAPADLARRLAPLRAGVPGGTFWLAVALVEHLGAVAAQRPLLVVLDDLHRGEGETLQLLRSVADGLAGAPVLVVATLRPAEVGPDLATALAALAGPVTDRIELGGLDVPAVRALLVRHGVTDPSEQLAALVAERTGGNPLFVRETARLVAVEGPAAAADAVPAGVRDVLRRRLARLPAPAQATLRQLAVLGRESDVELAVALAARVAGGGAVSEAPVLDALELGVLSGLLDEPAPDRVRFTHALVHATLYSGLPRLRRTRLHAAALDVVAGSRPDDHAALAHHALAAGPAVAPERALRHVPAAAVAAGAAGAHRDAARLWAAAVELADGDAAFQAAMRIRQVSALAHAGDVNAAVVTRSAAVATARALDRPDLLAAALTSYDAPVSWTIRQDRRVDSELVALLEDRIAATGTNTAEQVELRCRLLAALVFEVEGSDEARVRSASAEAMELSARGAAPAVRCTAMNARFYAVLAPDLWPELAGLGEELRSTAAAAGLAGYRSQGHHLLFMAAAAELDLDGAQRHADAAVAAAPGGQLGFTLGWSAAYAALRALVEGRLEESERTYTAVAEQLAVAGASNAEAFGAFGRFAVRHAMGRAGDAVPDLARLHRRIPVPVAEPYAVALLAAGRRDDAAAVWQPHLPLPRDYYWLLWTAMRAEVAIGLGDREVAAACYADLLPHAGTLAGVSSGSVTLGPVGHLLADLAQLLGLPGAAQHRRAGDAVARRLGAAHWQRG